MTDIFVSQAYSLGLITSEAEEIRVPAMFIMAVANHPTESIEVSNAALLSVIRPDEAEEIQLSALRADSVVDTEISERISKLYAMVVVKGRIDSRKLRVWTFSLDGHDYYVIRLGMSGSLVYDTTTEQWSEWTSNEEQFWRAVVGQNWLSMGRSTFMQGYTTNIVAGDDTFGQLWILDPTQGYDDHVRSPDKVVPVYRMATGQVPQRLRQFTPCFGVYLTASLGSPSLAGADIKLLTSDDAGKTYFDHGTITILPGDWEQELSWESLGLIQAPGRIFRIEDQGAVVRIDSLDMEDPNGD